MIVELKQSPDRLMLGNLTCPTFADDITIVALNNGYHGIISCRNCKNHPRAPHSSKQHVLLWGGYSWKTTQNLCVCTSYGGCYYSKWHAFTSKPLFSDSVVLLRINGPCTGPLWRFTSICKKYNVYNILANGIEKGAYVSMTEWKSFVKKTIWDRANSCYIASYSICKSLKYGSLDMANIKMHTWWLIALKISTMYPRL